MYFTVISKRKFTAFISVVIAIVTLLVSTLCGGVVSAFKESERLLPIYYVKTEQKKIAISFDCAWGVDYTDKLLETMDQEQVKCTFFMVEFWTKKYPDYVKKIFDYGHEIGTHSATHPHMSKLSKADIERELSTSTEAIESITSKKVEVFRAPYGEYNNLLINTAKEKGLYTIQWDVDSLDWKDLTAEQICSRVLSRVKNGSIVLFHNQGLHTHEALPIIISELKNQGYEFTSIGDLIYRDNYKMGADGAQIKLL